MAVPMRSGWKFDWNCLSSLSLKSFIGASLFRAKPWNAQGFRRHERNNFCRDSVVVMVVNARYLLCVCIAGLLLRLLKTWLISSVSIFWCSTKSLMFWFECFNNFAETQWLSLSRIRDISCVALIIVGLFYVRWRYYWFIGSRFSVVPLKVWCVGLSLDEYFTV